MKSRKNSSSGSARRRVAVMGSTGSIGRQTLDIIGAFPGEFEAVALTANTNWEALAAQALSHRPALVAIADEQCLEPLREALAGTGIRVAAGKEALVEAATLEEADTVVGALVGYSGLDSTIAALEAGKSVALANKETLVVAGEIISRIVSRKKKRIIPVDSEHSAIFQCLWGEQPRAASRIILTASGGPFRTLSRSRLENVTLSQALSHPNWNMGMKVTIDSATMMNKGFEMIEARWLFDMAPQDIEVLVHPESIVHSMVEFVDGSVKAQLGLPDMHLPIAVALGYPHRLDLLGKMGTRRLNLAEIGKLTFETPDFNKFPLLSLAYAAAERGGLVPALMNAANEVAVKAFAEGRIGFNDISRVVISTVNDTKGAFRDEAVTLASIAEAHKEGTKIAFEHTFKIIKK
ncbi:MAG: 1-deoxy-D-xylulose-5-phosphate reductoisomerase [Muribaculaceae bacterium]|nr:1-deoxy-D-xylulose-5-phosphate reductoisomerase [Muribaculaceae bacterium]